MTRKPLFIKLHEFESTASYISRFAALYSAPDAVVFSSWFGARFKDLCEGSSRELQRISGVIQQDAGILMDRTVVGRNNVRKFWGMNISFYHVRHSVDRVCPGCINDDIANADGQLDLRPYGRMTWMMEHLHVCPRHSRPLVKLPSLPWELSNDFRKRLALAREVSPGLFEAVDSVEPLPFERYIVGRLEGFDRKPSWLDHLPLPAVLNLCEAIGEQGPGLSIRRDGERRDNDKANDGFVRIGGGEEDFKRELTERLACRRQTRQLSTSSAFSQILTGLEEDLLTEEYARVRRLMREVAIEVLPLGPEDDMFGPITSRTLHSVRTGAREYEIPASLLRIALKTEWASDYRKKSMPAIFETARVRDAYLSLLRNEPAAVAEGKARFAKMLERERRGIEQTAREESSSASMLTVEKLLRVNCYTVRSLADEGYLPIFRWKIRGSIVWRIANEDLAYFMIRYISMAELRALLREKKKANGCKLTVGDFQPVITRSEVGYDFFDRCRIIQTI